MSLSEGHGGALLLALVEEEGEGHGAHLEGHGVTRPHGHALDAHVQGPGLSARLHRAHLPSTTTARIQHQEAKTRVVTEQYQETIQ